MEKYIILSEKTWHQDIIVTLKKKLGNQWYLINTKQDFTLEKLREIQPRQIFIPHWSYIIPASIYENYECIVFHMTDLPYGRGGSPLQNLIVRGHKDTKISAIRVEKGIDTGAIYLKKSLSLLGTAEEIFIRSVSVIEQMVVEMVGKSIQPKNQEGSPTIFKRRKPAQSDMSELDDLNKIYDFIRMLDAEGYPKAFLETQHFRLEFSRASLKGDKSIIADVRIIQK